MPIDIDPNFSVYRLLERVKQRETAVMRHRRTMSVVSYEIENATLLDGAHTRIFSSFQRMSKFIPQIERYRMLAQRAESVYVFGIPDVRPPEIENVTYIDLKPTDALAKEWFLVSYGRDYASTLATQELTNIDDPDDEREFEGIWTFDTSLTSILETWLTRTVNARPMFIEEDDLNMVAQQSHITQILKRLEDRTERPIKRQSDSIVQKEVRDIIESDVRPLALI